MEDLKAIKLSDKLSEDLVSYKSIYGRNLHFLHPVSRINIFVGSNNSGKSRFMRALAKQEQYFYLPEIVNFEKAGNAIRDILLHLNSSFNTYHLKSVQDISANELLDELSNYRRSVDINLESIIKLRDAIGELALLSEVKTAVQGSGKSVNLQQNILKDYQTRINNAGQSAIEVLDKMLVSEEAAIKRVYIPSIRGLRPLEETHKDFYEERTRQDYFSKGPGPEIFTGLTLYKRIKRMRNGTRNERRLLEQYENFLAEKLFENKPISLIPSDEKEIVVVEIGEESDLEIYRLGDGIQSAIILTFLPYIYQDPAFFFIEEPEMYMHPGLQRKLLDFYSKLNRHTFFLTTHSNHFLDLTIDVKDVSIFTIRKIFDDGKTQPDFTVEAIDRDHQSSLELLGVRNSSVFLVNATVWVEGITDRLYFREMLNSYMDWLAERKELPLKLEEDAHYCFVEYGGANITHFSFLDTEEPQIEVDRLCSRAILIIDADGNSKLERKEKLEKKLEERLIQLPCREVENLLPYDVIKAVVREFEKNPDLEFRNRGYDSYKNDYLGTFIESEMFKENETRKRGYRGGKTGTVNSKVEFCKKALQHIKYETLPETTQEVIRQIYKFIVERNS